MLAVLVAMLRRLRAVELRLQALQCLLDCLCCNRLGASFLGDKQVYVLPCHRPRSIRVMAGSVVGRSTEASFDGCNGGLHGATKPDSASLKPKASKERPRDKLTLQQEGRQ